MAFRSFGQITHTALQDLWVQRKKTRTAESVGGNDTIHGPRCKVLGEKTTITDNVVVLCRHQREPLATVKGAASKNAPRGTGYMDAAAWAGGADTRV